MKLKRNTYLIALWLNPDIKYLMLLNALAFFCIICLIIVCHLLKIPVTFSVKQNFDVADL